MFANEDFLIQTTPFPNFQFHKLPPLDGHSRRNDQLLQVRYFEVSPIGDGSAINFNGIK